MTPMTPIPDAAPYLKVAFPIPNNPGYWYANSQLLGSDPKLKSCPAGFGYRVEAPLGRSVRTGFVVETAGECPIDAKLIKPIKRSLDAEPVFGAQTLELASWVAKMYFCSLGEALGLILPSGRRESAPPAAEIEDFRIGDFPLPLTAEQNAALEGILSVEGGTSYLYGATGTGKTEVFLQAAERTIAAGRSVIYLVPDIALTGQVVRSARKRFGETCAVLHSRLTPSKRLAEWRKILSGQAAMVIGARSAIFAPLSNLGLIVIDEEHEGSYKSGSSPRYHARQVAMRRAGTDKARLILGSATPSVEAWHAGQTGAMKRHILTMRPGGGSFPKIEIVDMRAEEGTLSKALVHALQATKDEGRQSILFLNRRGFSHFFVCQTCGAELTCRNCSVSLTYHKESDKLVCHYCGYKAAPPKACPECKSLDVGWRGFGTERVEEELKERFPNWNIARLDADATSRVGSLEAILEDFRSGRIDLLVGTQMVAKGLNFPGVKTIGIVLADAGLNLPDFRASERVFSLIVQVAGRAGRYDDSGAVYLQTFRPESQVIRKAATLDVEGFYSQELAMRQAQGFPPFARLARIVVRSKERGSCIAAAGTLAHQLESLRIPDLEILGPSECALSLVAGTYRWQILLRAENLPPLRSALAALDSSAIPSSTRVELDIDPVHML
jgi:primosomal protein N' (replication factor Y)